MSKRRKVWWIASGVVTALALFALTVFLIDYNSTDAKIERAVAQIVEEYGFELEGRVPGSLVLQQKLVIVVVYMRAPVETETADEIVTILRAACPSWEHEVRVYDEDHVPVTTSSGDPWTEVHEFRPAEQYSGRVAGVGFSPDNKGFGKPEIQPSASISLLRLYRPSLWEKIKGMWPW